MNCSPWWRASSLPNALRVSSRCAERSSARCADADPAHRVREPPAGEPLLRDLEALALVAEQVAERDAHVARARSPGCPPGECEPIHSGWRTIRQPGVSVGHEDQRVVAVAAASSVARLGDDDRERRALGAGDAPLAAVEHPARRRRAPRSSRGSSGRELATSGSVIAKHERIGPRPAGAGRSRAARRVPAISSVCMLPSSGAIALRPSEASAADAALLRDRAPCPSAPMPEPAPLLGQVRRVDPALARAVAQPLDDVPAREHVGGVGDLRLGGQRVLLDVRAHAGDEVPSSGESVKSSIGGTLARPAGPGAA